MHKEKIPLNIPAIICIASVVLIFVLSPIIGIFLGGNYFAWSVGIGVLLMIIGVNCLKDNK